MASLPNIVDSCAQKLVTPDATTHWLKAKLATEELDPSDVGAMVSASGEPEPTFFAQMLVSAPDGAHNLLAAVAQRCRSNLSAAVFSTVRADRLFQESEDAEETQRGRIPERGDLTT